MAFDLPRAARSLRFTGQVRALARPRTARTPPARVALGGRGSYARPLAAAAWDDDDLPTTVAPRTPHAPPSRPAGRARLDRRPIPGFPPAQAIIPGGTHLTPTVAARHRRRGLPLLAWLVLSFLSATISYRVVPPVVEQLGLAPQALAR